ncbi:MAG: SH3 domain-containing protein [Candidatus Peribacteraceae bacterium]|nr:SH3 domain-containing protein [Candidatus Peribacteraceae bacterium]MDD5739990.1 SH3 domain-containing protein [Candidatus Peribacteraceae bacterium]
MSRYYQPPRRSMAAVTTRSFIAFLLIASFGILFAGCGSASQVDEEEFSFTAEDLARFRELAQQADMVGSGTTVAETSSGVVMELAAEQKLPTEPPVLDLSLVKTYDAVRTGPGLTSKDTYQVTNEFLNVRSAPNVTSSQVARLLRGETVTVLEFMDAAWAKVRLADNREGYISQRYIAKIVSEEQLKKEKEAFAGQYYVNFGFVNVRKGADSDSEKLGELPGQAFVKPVSHDENWARISFQGKEGYVAMQYLSPFLPNFLVRQNTFTLPILHYRLSQQGSLDALVRHLPKLKAEGVSFITMDEFADLLLKQQEKDIRLPPKAVVIAVSDITAENVREASDALTAASVKATLFIPSKELGLSGITEKTLLTLLANGFDLESGGHTGDDLRSLTNAQVELELTQSRKLLEEYTHGKVRIVGYPEGGVNERVAQYAAQAGYLLGVGVAPDRSFQREQLLRLPSFLVSPTATDQEVLTMVKGS